MKVPSVNLVLIALVATAGGCQPAASQAPEWSVEPSLSPVPDSEPPRQLDPRIERGVAELAYARDYHHWAFLQQPPAIGRFPEEVGPPRADAVYARVLGFVGPGSRRPQFCPGLRYRDGRLKPCVVMPYVELSASQARHLVALANRQDYPQRVGGSEGVVKHRFVFYDERNVPAAVLMTDLEYRKWNAEWSEAYSEEIALELLELCQQLDMPLCFLGDHTISKAVYDEYRRRYWRTAANGVRSYVVPPFRVPLSTRLDALSDYQRRELCAWYREAVEPPYESGGVALQRGDMIVAFLTMPQCLAAFPKCSATVGEVLPCMRIAQLGDPLFEGPGAAGCERWRHCLWGVASCRGSIAECERQREALAPY